MTEIVIDRKKYVLVVKKEFVALQKKAALTDNSGKILTIEKARKYSKKLITE